MQHLDNDSLMEVEHYRIKDYKTINSPYEGYYLHYNNKVTSKQSPLYEKAHLNYPVFRVFGEMFKINRKRLI
ncbi:hypothetical protein [Psychroflexus sp. MBR-150]|jgi:hypothetical protein